MALINGCTQKVVSTEVRDYLQVLKRAWAVRVAECVKYGWVVESCDFGYGGRLEWEVTKWEKFAS